MWNDALERNGEMSWKDEQKNSQKLFGGQVPNQKTRLARLF